MGIAAGLAAAGLATSIGSTIAGAAGGGGGGNAYGTYGGNPAVYIPTGQSTVDMTYQDLLNAQVAQAHQLPGQVTPQYQQLAAQLTNNPYAAQAQQGANLAAQAGLGVSGMQLGGASQLAQMGAASAPYGAQILQTGFDPQQALYNRTQQQTADQLNAQLAQMGLSSSPYGAGLASQGLTNFNIDWQNQQLARQQQAAQGYGALTSATGQALQGASALGQGGLGTLVSSQAAPYTASTGQASTGIQGLNSLVSGIGASYGLSDAAMQSALSYLGMGQGASGLAQAGQGAQFLQNQATGQQLASALSNPALASGLQNIFGSPAQSTNQFMGFGPSGYNPGDGGAGYGASFSGGFY